MIRLSQVQQQIVRPMLKLIKEDTLEQHFLNAKEFVLGEPVGAALVGLNTDIARFQLHIFSDCSMVLTPFNHSTTELFEEKRVS